MSVISGSQKTVPGNREGSGKSGEDYSVIGRLLIRRLVAES